MFIGKNKNLKGTLEGTCGKNDTRQISQTISDLHITEGPDWMFKPGLEEEKQRGKIYDYQIREGQSKSNFRLPYL